MYVIEWLDLLLHSLVHWVWRCLCIGIMVYVGFTPGYGVLCGFVREVEANMSRRT